MKKETDKMCRVVDYGTNKPAKWYDVVSYQTEQDFIESTTNGIKREPAARFKSPCDAWVYAHQLAKTPANYFTVVIHPKSK
jgi:hypothetical protein